MSDASRSRLLAERAEHGHEREGLPSTWWRWLPSVIMPRRICAPCRRVLPTGRAVAAAAAAGHEAGRHVVADLQLVTPGRPRRRRRALVATDERKNSRPNISSISWGEHVARHHVLVAVAHARSLPVHEDLTGLRRVDVDLLDLPVLPDPTGPPRVPFMSVLPPLDVSIGTLTRHPSAPKASPRSSGRPVG